MITFLTNVIQTLQHQWKKYMNHKGDYVKKYISFGHIRWQYLGQPKNFSANTFILIGYKNAKVLRAMIILIFIECIHEVRVLLKHPLFKNLSLY